MIMTEINLPEVMGSLTVEMSVTGTRSMRHRLKLGAMILRVAAFVIGAKSDVTINIRSEP